jgi:predicted small lipoprotein YifL
LIKEKGIMNKKGLLAVVFTALLMLTSCGAKAPAKNVEAPADESNVIYTDEAKQAKEDEQENAKKGMGLNDESAVNIRMMRNRRKKMCRKTQMRV